MKGIEHQKHAKLARPQWGKFGRQEIALMGAACDTLATMAKEMVSAINGQLKAAWLDAYHPEDSDAGRMEMSTDRYGNALLKVQADIQEHELRPYLSDYDLLIVNGNHFRARQQVVILDPVKKDSLSRKMDRLTDIICFVQTEQVMEPYAFIKEGYPGWDSIPIVSTNKEILSIIQNTAKGKTPPLKGLVLAGGKSQRMGRDKAFLEYHGKPQYKHTAELIAPFCREVYISCRPGQEQEFEGGLPCIPDSIEGLGPYAAILSAFREDPESSWLVVACDLPYIDASTIRQLTAARDTSKIATAFHNHATGFPDPLITIWEPKAYPRLLYFLSQGYSCPRKALINSDITLIEPEDQLWLNNINTPEEYKASINTIK